MEQSHRADQMFLCDELTLNELSVVAISLNDAFYQEVIQLRRKRMKKPSHTKKDWSGFFLFFFYVDQTESPHLVHMHHKHMQSTTHTHTQTQSLSRSHLYCMYLLSTFLLAVDSGLFDFDLWPLLIYGEFSW